ncbi:MAG: hypothetical protein HFJ34_06770 [Clostridia bacterium]|nr:hypothetical protein [Clostridia bacterium]
MRRKQKLSIKIETILCLYIVLCPILDMVSFIFRNTFHTNFSPSTFLRPILPSIVIVYLFFKKDKKFKIYTVGIGLLYFIYAILHLWIFKNVMTGSSYSGILHEAQYLINYSYMIVNLFIYITIFKENEKIEKLSKSVLLANFIYIASIIISILTKTSSNTYIEGMGYKGWFESGNSLGSILILSLFMILKYSKDRKYRILAIPSILLEGIFLTMLLGTRVGLYGFILVVIIYILIEIVVTLKQKEKLNKKMIAGAIAGITTFILIIITIGSVTMQRRRHLQEIEKDIVDTTNYQEAHVTGSILEIKEKIEKDSLEEGYMGEAEKQSIIDLYNIANRWKIKNNDQRMQQLIYNVVLIKNQHNPIYIFLGNGHVNNFRELVLEMEVPAFLLDFGILGFLLYCMPFLFLFLYGVYFMIKNRTHIEVDYLMYLAGCGFTFALSFFAGYTFFNSSNMMMIVILNTLLINRIMSIKKKEGTV